jgi:hypothetical protein
LDVARNLIEQLSAPSLIKFADAKGMKNLLERFIKSAVNDTAKLAAKSYELNDIAFRYKLFSDKKSWFKIAEKKRKSQKNELSAANECSNFVFMNHKVCPTF